MSAGLLYGHDDEVAHWFYTTNNRPVFKYDACIGVISNNRLVGAVLYRNWNGPNIELSYYGQNTLTPGILRSIFGFALKKFDVVRITCITSKKNRHFMKSLQKIGFKLEGAQKCYYGRRDCNRNTGVRFVMFREGMERIAFRTRKKAA